MDIIQELIPGIIVYFALMLSGYLKFKKSNSLIAFVLNVFIFVGSITYIYYILETNLYFGAAYFIILYIEGKIMQVLLEYAGK